ncbi:glycosyltransferase [Candidatus Falkowbacteria bacterium]|jgi:glycosyltransferase involved in cell wall biosynthesis|nr:glycosyltransferase [Candidatus Falkowbacteria bacterium]MBT4432743.1 glycosyltransferase [Candidatus Falkowbacteria bacterium]
MSKLNNKKIIILQDYFLYKGGGERSMIELAKALGADIATSFISKDAFNPRDHGIKTIELTTEGGFSHIPGWRFLKVQFSFVFKTRFLKKYDIIIYSGDCISAVHNCKDKLNVAYVHTPPRHLFDNYKIRLNEYKGLKRLIFRPYVWVSRWRYKRAIPKMDLLIANSKNVQKRIKKYLGMASVVIYPPGDTLNFKWISQGDYYFSWARLYDVKRVDKIVEAFTKMPEKKLVVASGGPELEKIKKIAKGHDNIKILNWISDEKLLELIGNCLATIYIPLNEDFGMSPVESMMAGKPVVGVNEGGLKETIIDDKTGILLKSDFNIQDIARAVRELTSGKAIAMRNACEEQAKKFSVEEFINGVAENIESKI